MTTKRFTTGTKSTHNGGSAADYLTRYYYNKDINAIATGPNEITTYLSRKPGWDTPKETVDTYKLINNARRKGYTIIRTKEVR